MSRKHRPTPARGDKAGVNFFDVFRSVDEMYLSRDAAESALGLHIPGGKPSRSDTVVLDMLRAARKGLANHYRQTINAEWIAYEDELERAVKKVGPPRFSEPPIEFDEASSDASDAATQMMEHAKSHYEQVMVVARAKRAVVTNFGARSLRAAFAAPKERGKVAMVLEMLRAAFDGRARGVAGYQDPRAVELALVAVAVGLDDAMKSSSDEDAGENRRARWQATLKTARRLLARELEPEPRSAKGR